MGGAQLKAVLNEIQSSKPGTGSGDAGGAEAGPAKGGEVLAILHDRMQRMSGDPSALSLHRALVRAAGRPYAQMLVTWTRTGKLDDPYEELCVKESKFINKGVLEMDYTDEYWERRYTVSLSLDLKKNWLKQCMLLAPRWIDNVEWVETPSSRRSYA